MQIKIWKKKKIIFRKKVKNINQRKLQLVQDLSIFSLKNSFFFKILLKILGRGICSSIYFILLIINIKIILKEFLGSVNLFGAQIFCIYELLEIIIVYKYKKFILTTF